MTSPVSPLAKKRLAGLALVAAMLTPGALVYLGTLWPTYVALGLLVLLVGGAVYLALFVWPHTEKW